ncbi:MAG: aldo/keto reductase [Lachnospiraceae bacterium]|nr:aldo/keto reductase [Lachnospiraceae bacterium]
MQYKKFGKTEMNISSLGLGGNFTLDIGKTCVEEQKQYASSVIKKAIELGINFFDTCPSYCGGYEEDIFGMAFENINETIYVGSKDGLQNKHNAEDVIKQIENSLKKMKRNYIDIFFLWSIMSFDDYKELLKPGGIYEGVKRAYDQGLVKHIGASLHCSTEDSIKIINDELVEGIIVSFNPVNYASQLPIVNAAQNKKIGVITMNSLGGGIIPRFPDLFEGIERSDRPVAEKCLRFIHSFEGITTSLSSMESIEKLTQNVTAFNDEYVNKYIVEKDFLVNVSDKLCTGCRYCEPCPVGVGVSKLMQGYNINLLLSKCESEKGAVNSCFVNVRSQGGDPFDVYSCVGCHKCEKKCTQKIPIVKRIQEMKTNAEKYGMVKEKIINRLDDFFRKYDGKKIGFWPTCKYMDGMLSFYNRPDIEEKLYFFNSSENFVGKTFRGKKIYGKDDVIKMGIQVILVANYNFGEEIYCQLKGMYEDKLGIDIVNLHTDDDIAWFW